MLYRFCEDRVDDIRNMSQTPKKEDNPAPAPTFKEQLDKEATGRDHEHDSDGHSIVQTVVDKSKSLIVSA